MSIVCVCMGLDMYVRECERERSLVCVYVCITES